MASARGVIAGEEDAVGGAGEGMGRFPEPRGRFRVRARGPQHMGPADEGADDGLAQESQQARIGFGDLGQDRGGLGAAARVQGPPGELGEIAPGGLAFAVGRIEGVQRRVEVDAVAGAEQGVRGGRGLSPFLFDREVVREAVVFAPGTGGIEEAVALEDAGRFLGAAEGYDQPCGSSW